VEGGEGNALPLRLLVGQDVDGRRLRVRPGVNIKITIFYDFCQFSAKKMAFFLKTNVMIQFLHNLAVF
jgi:hypothetical protein